ncbi:MAG: biotin synthase BioB [Candidatus Omnitrophica bacterium]|nr:biotin synthase BioB [Candidatus Omnitrophota bacterium]
MRRLTLDKILSMPFDELILTANRVRQKNCGGKVEACGIVNAKSGSCSEDCKFCAQSARYSADIGRHPLVSAARMVEAAEQAQVNGATRFGIVTSGNRLSPGELEIIAKAIKSVRQNLDILPCASLGCISEKGLIELKRAGLVRYHHNLETSKRFYPEVVTTHNYDERVRIVKLAVSLGLEVCSGGIFGLGETWQDRMDLANLLKELNVDAAPLNFFIPIKGTPFENKEPISSADAVKIVAIFRIILKNADIKVVAGRETILKDFQALLYMAGANGMMIGGYLTKQGRSSADDKELLGQVRELWN